MRLAGITMTIEGTGGEKSPPLPFIEVSSEEGAVLLALYPKGLRDIDALDASAPGNPTEADLIAAAPEPAPLDDSEAERLAAEAAAAEAERVAAAEAAAQAEAERVAAEEAARAAADSANGSGGDDTLTDEEAARLAAGEHPADLVEAFELIEPDDLVKTGDRAGRPKASAIKAILDRDVAVADIDAAWAARTPAA